jgi:RNA:NAD 2'-phosphotransferase (TPT1/KptA family)
MEEQKYLGWRAEEAEVKLAEEVRKKTGERSISAVLSKSLKHYAKANGVKVPA